MMLESTSFCRTLLLTLIALALVACGGGGGGSDNPETAASPTNQNNPPPDVDLYSITDLALQNCIRQVWDYDLASVEELVCYGVRDLTGIEQLEALSTLTLSVGTSHDTSQPLPSLARLGQLQNLESLKLQLGGPASDPRTPNYDFLTGLPNLVELGLTWVDNQHLDTIAQLHQLLVLELGTFGENTSGLFPLPSCSNLVDVSDLRPINSLANLRVFTICSEQLADLSPLNQLPHLLHLYIYAPNLQDISPLSSASQLLSLILAGRDSGMGIADYTPISALTNLELLALNDTTISNLSVIQPLTALRLLQINNGSCSPCSSFSNINELASLTALERVFLYGAPSQSLQTVDLAPLAAAQGLTEVYLDSYRVTNLGAFSGHPALSYLRMSRTDGYDFADIGSIPALRDFIATESFISDLSGIASAFQVERMDLSINQISSLTHLIPLSNLKELNLSSNVITDVSALNPLVSLQTLNLNGNQINDISPLQSMSDLVELHLMGNGLANIDPAANLPSLETLVASWNQIANASALANSDSIKELWLSNNEIQDASFALQMSVLERLYIEENPNLDCSTLGSVADRDFNLSSDCL